MDTIKVSLSFQPGYHGTLTTARGDYPLGDSDKGLSPYDMMLGALGTCYYHTFLDIVTKMRLEMTGATLDIVGVKRDEVPTTLTTVDMHMTVKGAEGDQKRFERAAKLAEEYCSVHATISKVAEIAFTLTFA